MKSAISFLLLTVAILLLAVPGMASITPSPVGSHSIMITQFYINGGNTNAPYTYGFLELFNAGPVAIDLTDFVLEYQSSTGSMGPTNTFVLGPHSDYSTGGKDYPATTSFPYNNDFDGILQPGQYLLIQLPGQGKTTTAADLPITPDIVLPASLNGTVLSKPSTAGGKWAIAHTFSGLYCGSNSNNPARSNPTTDPYHVLIGPMATDFAGYYSSSTPNCYEGSAPANINPDSSISSSKNNVTSIRAFADGCPVDTNDNGTDFTMMKIGPGMTNGWTLHNSKQAITNGDTSETYQPVMCPQSLNTAPPIVEATLSLADDATATPITEIEEGKETALALTVTVTDGGTNPTSAIGYRLTADFSGLGAIWTDSTTQSTVLQKLGYWQLDPAFGNPQYQFPIPPEDPAPTTPPATPPPTLTLNPPMGEKGNVYTIPVTIVDDAQRQIETTVSLNISGNTPGTATVSALPALIPVSVATPVAFTAKIASPGKYPAGTSFTVTMDLSSIGGGNAVDCPSSGPARYTCNTSVNPPAGDVGKSYSIPVTIVDDQARTLTLTPDSIELPVTAEPEPLAILAWVEPSMGNFGSVMRGQTSPITETAVLTNTGAAALSVASVSTDNADFSATTCPASIASGASCTITLTFKPTVIGDVSGNLVVTDNSLSVDGSQQTLALTGAGTPPPPTADLSATALHFGNQVVTSSATAQTVTLTNNGGLPLSISALSLTGGNASDFSYTTTCKASLPDGSSCVFNVTFTPVAAGDKTAVLTITDNASGSPHTVTFDGTGVDFPLAPAESQQTAKTITAGSTVTFNLQLSPTGPLGGSVTVACTTVIQGATCTTNPSSITPTGTDPIPITLSITTTAPSKQVAQSSSLTVFMGGQGRPGSKGPGMPMGILALTILAGGIVAMSRRRQWSAVALSAVLLCVMGMSACAGLKTAEWPTQPAIATPPGTYQVMVTATAGSVVRTTTVTLTVN